MTFLEYHQNYCDAIVDSFLPLAAEMGDISAQIDETINAGETPDKEIIDAMFEMINKLKANASILEIISMKCYKRLKEIIDEPKHEEEEEVFVEEEEQTIEEFDLFGRIKDVRDETRAIVSFIIDNDDYKEVIEIFNEFADYIDSFIE